MPDVRWVLPDSHIHHGNNDYGGVSIVMFKGSLRFMGVTFLVIVLNMYRLLADTLIL